MGTIPEPGGALLDRLAAAVNSHDLDALEGCFAHLLDHRARHRLHRNLGHDHGPAAAGL